jgi:hypothetical protein
VSDERTTTPRVERSAADEGPGGLVVGEGWSMAVGEPLDTLGDDPDVDAYLMSVDDADPDDAEAVLAANPGAVGVDRTPADLLRAALRHADPDELDDETSLAELVDERVGPEVDHTTMLDTLQAWEDDDAANPYELVEDEDGVDPALAAAFEDDRADVNPVVEGGSFPIGVEHVGATENGRPLTTHRAEVTAVTGPGEGHGRTGVDATLFEVDPGADDSLFVQGSTGLGKAEQAEAVEMLRIREAVGEPTARTVVAQPGPLLTGLDPERYVNAPAGEEYESLVGDLAERAEGADDATTEGESLGA